MVKQYIGSDVENVCSSCVFTEYFDFFQKRITPEVLKIIVSISSSISHLTVTLVETDVKSGQYCLSLSPGQDSGKCVGNS